MDELVTIAKAAKILSLHPQTVYRKISRGEIPAVRIGRSIRVKLPQIGESVKKETTVPAMLDEIFWDVKPKRSTDRIVIERVLEFGDLAAIRWLVSSVDKSLIIDFLNSLGRKRLTNRSYNFYKIVFGVTNERKNPLQTSKRTLGKDFWR